jgi:hypothetical protein
MKWARHVALMGYMRNAYEILTGNPKWARGKPFRRPKISTAVGP